MARGGCLARPAARPRAGLRLAGPRRLPDQSAVTASANPGTCEPVSGC
jgi:hypothetical protein